MIEGIHAEFVGGPLDGQIRFLPDETNEVRVHEHDNVTVDKHGKVQIVNHNYLRRSIGGIFVRLPNGFYPFDWKGVVE